MRHDPFDLKQQEQAEERERLEDRLERDWEAEDIKWLCSSKRGRRIVWRLLDQSGVFRLSFDPNCAKMAFNEGNRNFGNRTLALIQSTCPEHFLTMTKEANERTEQRSARRNK